MTDFQIIEDLCHRYIYGIFKRERLDMMWWKANLYMLMHNDLKEMNGC